MQCWKLFAWCLGCTCCLGVSLNHSPCKGNHGEFLKKFLLYSSPRARACASACWNTRARRINLPNGACVPEEPVFLCWDCCRGRWGSPTFVSHYILLNTSDPRRPSPEPWGWWWWWWWCPWFDLHHVIYFGLICLDVFSESPWPQRPPLQVADIRDGSFAKAEAMKMNVCSNWNLLDVLAVLPQKWAKTVSSTPWEGTVRSTDQTLQTQSCQTRPKKSWRIFATTPAVCRTADGTTCTFARERIIYRTCRCV